MFVILARSFKVLMEVGYMVCHLALEVVTHYFIRAYCGDILSMLGIEKMYLKLGYCFLKILVLDLISSLGYILGLIPCLLYQVPSY